MGFQRVCGAIVVGLLLSMGLSPAAALASKASPRSAVIVTPVQSSAPALSFDTLRAASPAAGTPLMLPLAAGCTLAMERPNLSDLASIAPEACAQTEIAGSAPRAVFSSVAIVPPADDEALSPREQRQPPFPDSDPATYSLVLAGIGLVVTIARRRMQ